MGLSAASQAVLQVLVLACLARLMVPAQFGLVSAALVVILFTTIVAQGGIGTAIVQRPRLEVIHIRVGFTAGLLMGVGWCLAVEISAPLIEHLFRLPGLTEVLRVIALVLVIQSLTLSDFLLARRVQFGRLAAAEATAYALGYGAVAVTMAALGFGVWSIVGGQLAQTTLRTALVTVMAPHSVRPSLARGPLRELLAYGGGHTLAQLANSVAVMGDNVVVGRYLGAAALGLYGRAYQLVSVPATLFGQVANEVLFPAMAAVQHDRAALRRVYGTGTAILAIVALPISVLCAVTSAQLVLVLLGPQWLGLRDAFDVILFGMLFRTGYKLSDSLARATGAVYRRAWRQGIYAACVVVGALIGQRWGIRGVAIGVLIALLENYLLMAHLSLSLIDMPWTAYARRHVPAAVMSTVAGVAAFVVRSAGMRLHLPSVAVLLSCWICGLLAVVILLRIAPRVPFLVGVGRPCAETSRMLPARAQRLLQSLVGSRCLAIGAVP
jgi:O-antigen/teichoic acid export membrane protein